MQFPLGHDMISVFPLISFSVLEARVDEKVASLSAETKATVLVWCKIVLFNVSVSAY